MSESNDFPNDDYPSFSGEGDRACLSVDDPELFMGEVNFPRSLKARLLVEEAKKVCNSCSYQQDCAIYALRHIGDPLVRGVWGGLSEEDRRVKARARIRTPVSLYTR